MKILIVNTFYYPNVVGGAENSVRLLAENLSKKNDVMVFSVDSFDKKSKMETVDGVKVYRSCGGNFNTLVRYTKKGSKLIKIKNKLIELRNNKTIKEFCKILDDFKPDVVHTNNIYGISPLVWKECAKRHVKIVHTIRDYWILSPDGLLPEKNKKLVKLYQKYFRKYTNYVSFVTAPSQFTLDNVLKFNYFKNSNSKCVVNSIELDIEETKKLIEEKETRKDKIINFLFVGSLFDNKGIINLLNAFSKIENENVRLNICGDGKLRDLVIERANNDSRIIYHGKLGKDDLKKIYIQNDVLVIPSIWDEPFGRVVIEANQYGLPVIGSNKAGIKEILDFTKTGILFQYDDIEDLKDKIIIYSSRNNIKKYYNNIIERIDYYSVESQIKSFIKIYEDVIKGE